MNLLYTMLPKLTKNNRLVLFSILVFSFAIAAQPLNEPYSYPILPGTQEWGKFKSHSEMINACQIPQDILVHLSTYSLIITCIHYPLFGDLFAYNNFQMGFECMAANFNGFNELFHRTDLVPEILRVYKSMDGLGTPDALGTDGKMRFMYMEMLLAQPYIISNLSKNGKHILLAETYRKFSAKQSLNSNNSNFQLTPSCILMSKLIKDKIKIENVALNAKFSMFIDKPFIIDSELIPIINGTAKRLLNY